MPPTAVALAFPFISLPVILLSRAGGFFSNMMSQRLVIETVTDPRLVGTPLLNETGTRRIINGELVELGETPYLVSFRFARRPSPSVPFKAFCGGTLLRPRKALSASHCFMYFHDERHTKEKYLRKVIAVMGVVTNVQPLNALVAPAQYRRLKNVWYPDNYIFPMNDIAVVILKEPFELTAHVGVLPLAQEFMEYTGTCLAVGFGVMDYDEKGDSGGPLVCAGGGRKGNSSWVLAGIACANIIPKDKSPRFSMFTRVSSFISYIDHSAAPTPPQVLHLHFALMILVMML